MPPRFIEQFVLEFDTILRTLSGQYPARRPNPAQDHPEGLNSIKEKKYVAALMRINHVGEVCAQALYQGQRLSCQDPEISQELYWAAEEEIDHLSWCQERLYELEGKRSILLPLWYLGALSIGYSIGRISSSWNLAFLSETEKQVAAHLSRHIQKLPPHDSKSLAILRCMYEEELNHSHMAKQFFPIPEIPVWGKYTMKASSWMMIQVAYWI